MIQAEPELLVSRVVSPLTARLGTFRKVKDLTVAIEAFIHGCNRRCRPFAWTKDTRQILATAGRPRLRGAGGSRSPWSAS